jgi:hypothetical protein
MLPRSRCEKERRKRWARYSFAQIGEYPEFMAVDARSARVLSVIG